MTGLAPPTALLPDLDGPPGGNAPRPAPAAGSGFRYNPPMRSRRDFLRLSAAAAAAAGTLGGIGRAARALPLLVEGAERRKALEKPLPKRKLGKTGLEVTIAGLGCFYLGNLQDDDRATGIVRRAFELGVNYFDTAPSYNKGVSERRVAKALAGHRDEVILATKSTHDDGPSAVKELEGSLGRLGTDHVDIFQFHALRTAEEVETLFGEGGAFEAVEKAKKEGKVRHIGFTGHFDPGLLAAVARERPVETVLLPLNCIDRHEKSFEEGTLPDAVKRSLGIIAMKVFASGRLLDDPARSPTPQECLRYVLTLPVSTAIVGCASVEELEADLALAKTFEALTEKEMAALVEKTRPFVPKKIEWYKR